MKKTEETTVPHAEEITPPPFEEMLEAAVGAAASTCGADALLTIAVKDGRLHLQTAGDDRSINSLVLMAAFLSKVARREQLRAEAAAIDVELAGGTPQ